MRARWRSPAPRLVAVIAALLLLAALALVWLVPPRVGSIYPSCLFYKLTGYYCPGCGTGRALHDLLHLRIGEAFGHNPLFVLFTPLLAFWCGSIVWQALRHNIWREPRMSGWAAKLLGFVFLAYFLARNLPWEPFIRLRP